MALGVEDEQQFKQYSCPLFQGYLLSRPLDTDSFIELLIDQGKSFLGS